MNDNGRSWLIRKYGDQPYEHTVRPQANSPGTYDEQLDAVELFLENVRPKSNKDKLWAKCRRHTMGHVRDCYEYEGGA